MMISEHRSFGLLLEMERNSGIYQFTRLLILLGQKKQEVFFSSMLSQAVIQSPVLAGVEKNGMGSLECISCYYGNFLVFGHKSKRSHSASIEQTGTIHCSFVWSHKLHGQG